MFYSTTFINITNMSQKYIINGTHQVFDFILIHFSNKNTHATVNESSLIHFLTNILIGHSNSKAIICSTI